MDHAKIIDNCLIASRDTIDLLRHLMAILERYQRQEKIDGAALRHVYEQLLILELEPWLSAATGYEPDVLRQALLGLEFMPSVGGKNDPKN